jgi:hypothetical protein
VKTKTAIEHFGGVAKLAEALKISRTAIYLWKEDVPEGRAFQLELMTAGGLKAIEPATPVTGDDQVAA